MVAEHARFCGQCGTLIDLDRGEDVDAWLGRTIDGRYRVLARIGVGGMGVVYRVEHLHLGKMAAMKVLSPETAGNAEMVRRFRVEAQAVSRLNHPNIVQTFDFGQTQGALYLVMEFIKGEDLATLLRRDGPWSFERAARFFIQICSGLTEAHEAGIVHRDLKPENLMVVTRRDGSEHAKVLDFGLAKLRERAETPAVSSGGQVLGTPYYMAPEQVRGEPLDARADIYSLGATLYRVLTGEPPFDAPSPVSVLTKHLTDDLVPPRSRVPERALPAAADRIVLRAMEKLREDRYASAADVQRDFERTLDEMRGRGGPAVTVSLHVPATAADGRERDFDESTRLRRVDVDDFEHSLRRRRVLARIVYAVATIALAGAIAFAVLRRGADRADGVEHEPNNSPATATLLAQGTIRGTIGTPVNDREGDVDYYRVPASTGARVLSARLSAMPGVDLVLELFDAQGQRIVKSDARGVGEGEWLQPTAIGPNESYIAVREVWLEGTPPTSNAVDPYTLTVRWGAPEPGWEVEPNDWPASASPVPANGHVRGYLGSAEDRDWFSFTPERSGTIAATIAPPAGVDVFVYKDADEKRVTVRRREGGEQRFSFEGQAGKPVLVGIARRLPASAAKKDPKQSELRGLDAPYELTLDAGGGAE